MFNAVVDVLKAALKKYMASQHFLKIVFSYGLYTIC